MPWLRAGFADRHHQHSGSHLLHSLFGAGASTAGTIFKDFFRLRYRKGSATGLNGLEHLNQGVGGPAFAFNAPNASRTATVIDLGHRVRGGEDLVQVAYRALVGVAG